MLGYVLAVVVVCSVFTSLSERNEFRMVILQIHSHRDIQIPPQFNPTLEIIL